jgi:DICT domain-containing protein
MNHAQDLNKLIETASRRADFQSSGYRSFETENQADLDTALQAGNLFFTTSVLGMEAISHVIEDQALNIGGNFSFYTGFQKFSRMKAQQERYKKLCKTGNSINIFGIPDTQPWLDEPNLHVITLNKVPSPAEPNLAQNWFVVLNNPKFVSIALVAHELPGAKNPPRGVTRLVYRNFEGFWTYNQAVIDQLVGILDDYIQAGKNTSVKIKSV